MKETCKVQMRVRATKKILIRFLSDAAIKIIKEIKNEVNLFYFKYIKSDCSLSSGFVFFHFLKSGS